MANNIDQLKQKIQTSTILTSQERQEWLFLLPKMTSVQLEELDKLLSVRMPEVKPPAPAPVKATVKPMQVREEPRLMPRPQPVKDIKPTSPAPSDVESLKQISVEQMRKAPSVYLFLEELGKKMKDMVASRRATGEQIREAFEQSPLHRSYVSAGLKLMGGAESDLLNHAEFEALADFRASLRKILVS